MAARIVSTRDLISRWRTAEGERLRIGDDEVCTTSYGTKLVGIDVRRAAVERTISVCLERARGPVFRWRLLPRAGTFAVSTR